MLPMLSSAGLLLDLRHDRQRGGPHGRDDAACDEAVAVRQLLLQHPRGRGLLFDPEKISFVGFRTAARVRRRVPVAAARLYGGAARERYDRVFVRVALRLSRNSCVRT